VCSIKRCWYLYYVFSKRLAINYFAYCTCIGGRFLLHFIIFSSMFSYKVFTSRVILHYKELIYINKQTLENTEVTIKTDNLEKLANVGYTRRRNTKHKHNTICVGHQYTQTNTNNVNKTCTLLQTTGGKVRTEHRFYAEIVARHRTTERKDT
jgi:hypothetical protein